jgi:hypothetical protein
MWMGAKSGIGELCQHFLLMNLAFIYENRIMKPVEVVLRKGEGGMRENNGVGQSK